MLKSLSTIAALSLLMGCSRFDEAKEREECQKAHPNDQAVTVMLNFVNSGRSGTFAALAGMQDRGVGHAA